jgi:hypothetical protein
MGQVKYKKPGASKFEEFSGNKLKVKEYFQILKFARDGVEDIVKAISSIQQPKMSSEMKAAGYDKLNFGDLGLARTVGLHENIGTVEAYSLQMHIVIKSLDQLAATKRCDQAHTEIIKAKSKTKKINT